MFLKNFVNRFVFLFSFSSFLFVDSLGECSLCFYFTLSFLLLPSFHHFLLSLFLRSSFSLVFFRVSFFFFLLLFIFYPSLSLIFDFSLFICFYLYIFITLFAHLFLSESFPSHYNFPS